MASRSSSRRPRSIDSGSNVFGTLAAANNASGAGAPSMAGSGGLARSVTSEKFSSLMSLLTSAEADTQQEPPSRHSAAPHSHSRPTPSHATRPLSAAALLSPRSQAATAPRTSSAFPFSPSPGSNSATAASASKTRPPLTTAVPPSPSLSNSYSSDTFSPVSTPRSTRVGQNGFFTSPRHTTAAAHSTTTAAAAASSTSMALTPHASSASSYSSSAAPSTRSSSIGVGGGGGPLDSLKAKLTALKAELSTKDVSIAKLQDKVSSLDLERVSTASRHSEQLLSQKREYEQLLASNQSFVEKVLADKGELNSKCESLASKLASLEGEYASKEQHFRREVLGAELAKQKEAWLASEKLTRDKFLEARTKQIKAETLRALEPDIQKLLAKAAEQHKDAEASLERKHAQNLQDARSDHEQLISTVRKQHALELEHAREEERVTAQKKVRETIEKYDKQMMEQRQRYQSELEAARTRATTSSSALQSAVDAALLAQRKEHLVELAAAKEAHQQAVEDVTRRATLRETAERERVEIEKETWSSMMHAKMQRAFQEQERQTRAAMQQQHAEEIELIIDKLTKENELQCKEVVREYEKKIDGLKRQTTGDVSTSRRAAEELQTKLDSLTRKFATIEGKYNDAASQVSALQSTLTEKTRRAESLEEQVRELERKLATAQKDTLEKFSSEKQQLRTQFQVMQSRLDDAAVQSAAQSASFQSQLADSLAARDQDHAAQLAAMQTRVKDILAKKEKVIDALKQQLAKTQSEYDAQQRDILEQINL